MPHFDVYKILWRQTFRNGDPSCFFSPWRHVTSCVFQGLSWVGENPGNEVEPQLSLSSKNFRATNSCFVATIETFVIILCS